MWIVNAMHRDAARLARGFDRDVAHLHESLCKGLIDPDVLHFPKLHCPPRLGEDSSFEAKFLVVDGDA
jgi:hypothetical protein